MSTAGLLGVITDGVDASRPCIAIGRDIPRIHHGDGVPVYLVVDHPDGMPVRDKSNQVRTLLAYPSTWPAPGSIGTDWLYVNHEGLQWDALVPVFDGG